jgi:prepilin-type N-terminal cleavage/methylation domain-containing protein
MNTRSNTKGFTIIEVVLVLAIAALIFLMIFVALPALQRGQRDTARKNEAGTIASAITTYRSNNRGNLPHDDADLNSYLDNLNQITSVSVAAGVSNYKDPGEDEAVVVTGAKCTDGEAVVETGSPRQAAVVAFVESGGVYCQDV